MRIPVQYSLAMQTRQADLEKYETKAEVVEYINDHIGTHAILLESAALELAAPWGEEALDHVRELAKPMREHRATIHRGISPEAPGVATYQLLQFLVELEGRESIDIQMVGSGFTAEANYVANLPILADVVDGVSPRDIKVSWRSTLRRKGVEVEGIDDSTEG